MFYLKIVHAKRMQMGPARRNLNYLLTSLNCARFNLIYSKKNSSTPQKFLSFLLWGWPFSDWNQTLWLPKSFSDPIQTCNKPIEGYLVELTNSQIWIKLYLVKSDLLSIQERQRQDSKVPHHEQTPLLSARHNVHKTPRDLKVQKGKASQAHLPYMPQLLRFPHLPTSLPRLSSL